MVALIGNLSLQELVLIAALAVLLFGKRLPEVLGQALGQLRKVRVALDDLRRETGIDRELNTIERSFEDVTREAKIDDPLRAPAEPRASRSNPTPPPLPPKDTDAPDGGSKPSAATD